MKTCHWLLCGAVVLLGSVQSKVYAIQWQPPSTEAESRALANRPEYNGVGIITVPGSSATGALISEDWVLAAGHVVRGKTTGTFFLNGTNRSIAQIITRPDSDVALVRLSSPVTDVVYPAFAPYQYSNEVGSDLVIVGFGAHGETGTTLTSDFTRHAATNRIDSARNVGGSIGEVLVFSNTASGPSKTSLEGATAPGDSGGPMFIVENGRRWIVGETFGAIGGVGFVHGRVSEYKDWIETNTGINFNAVNWDNDPGTAGVQNGPGTWNRSNSNWSYSTQNFGWVDTYDATFGNGSDDAGTVTLGEDLGVGDLVFNPAASGNYTIAGAGNTLTLANGSLITTNSAADLAVNLSGGDVTKDGTQRLTLSNANAITGQVNVTQGNLRINDAGGLGTGGFSAATMTIIENGGALELDTADTTSITEHISIDGIGVAGQGSLVNISGDNRLTVATRLADDARIRVLAGSTLRAQSFFNGNELTITGPGELTVAARLDVEALRFNMGTGQATLLANAAASSGFTGNAQLLSGTLLINHEQALGAGTLEFGGATLGALKSLTGPRAIANDYALSPGSTTGFDSVGNTFDLELAGAGSITSGTATLTVADGETLNLSGVLSGAGGIIKRGTGMLTFEGRHTYAGATTVAQGTLAGSGGLTSTGGVTFQAGSALDPDGTFTFDLGTGSFDISAAVAADSSDTLRFSLGASSDQLVLTSGVLDIGVAQLGFNDFQFVMEAGLDVGQYTLFDTNALILGLLDPAQLTGTVGGFQGSLILADGGRDLALVLIPEPSAAGLLLLSLGLTMRRRRGQ